MSSFTSDIIVKPLSSGEFALLSSFEYYYAIGKDKTDSIKAEEGFVTNFASIPWFIHWTLKPTDKHIMAPSIIHDKLYATKVINHRSGKPFTRKEADQMMFEMMMTIQAPSWKLLSVYIALRLFGRKAYKA